MEMPTPCTNCGEIVEFDSIYGNPNGNNLLVCKSCYRELKDEEEASGMGWNDHRSIDGF